MKTHTPPYSPVGSEVVDSELEMKARSLRAQAVAEGSGRFARTVRALFANLKDRWEQRAAYRALSALDDRMLRDMGLNRDSIRSTLAEAARTQAAARRAARTRHARPVSAANNDAREEERIAA